MITPARERSIKEWTQSNPRTAALVAAELPLPASAPIRRHLPEPSRKDILLALL
jgi:flagellar motor switch protein FliG